MQSTESAAQHGIAQNSTAHGQWHRSSQTEQRHDIALQQQVDGPTARVQTDWETAQHTSSAGVNPHLALM